MPETDLEMMAILSWAAERVGLKWRPPPCPEPQRLDDWSLGVACAGSQHTAPGASLPKVHGELTGCGRHLLLPETNLLTPPSPPSMVVQLGSIRGSPRWSGRLRCSCVLISSPPGRINRASSSGPVGTRLVFPVMPMWPVEMLHPPYTMALLQVLQAKSTEGHARGWSRSGSSEELCTASDLAPRVTKVMVQSLGRAMSTFVVQECHRWLCLVDIGTPTKFGSSRALCPRLAPSAMQSGTWPSSSWLHRSRLRQSNTSCLGGAAAAFTHPPVAAPQLARRRGRPPASAPTPLPHPQQPPKAVPWSRL